MMLVSHIKSLIARPARDSRPRVAIFGDSHTAALASAQEFPERKHYYDHIRIHRLRKEKNGRIIGNSDLSAFCALIGAFGPEDFVFSAVGGNQYAVVSTVRDPVEYDFLPRPEEKEVASGAELVPFRALAGYIDKGVRGGMGPVLKELRKSTSARVLHFAPPPPKGDNAFIATRFETRFAREGLRDFGPTRPELRLKCWDLQLRCLQDLCRDLDVELVPPPPKSITPQGYLQPRFYADDVTHGNRRYGECVLKQVLDITGTAERARPILQ